MHPRPEEVDRIVRPAAWQQALTVPARRLITAVSLFRPDLRTAFEDLRDVMSIIEYGVEYIPDHEISLALERWIIRMVLYIEHRLLSIDFSDTEDSPTVAMEQCCQLATLIFTNTSVLVVIPPALMQVWLVPNFMQALVNHTPLGMRWGPYPDALFWVLCLGLGLTDSTDYEFWFV